MTEAFEESWARQLRTSVFASLFLIAFGGLLGWEWWAEDDLDRSTSVLFFCAFLGFSFFGLLLLWKVLTIRTAGLRIDDRGVTVNQGRRTLTFGWHECRAVQFWVRSESRSKSVRTSRSASRKRTVRIRILFAPNTVEFAPRPRMDHIRLRGEEPYTHVIRVIPTGPFASSMDRIETIDAALTRFGGDVYVGLDKNWE